MSCLDRQDRYVSDRLVWDFAWQARQAFVRNGMSGQGQAGTVRHVK